MLWVLLFPFPYPTLVVRLSLLVTRSSSITGFHRCPRKTAGSLFFQVATGLLWKAKQTKLKMKPCHINSTLLSPFSTGSSSLQLTFSQLSPSIRNFPLETDRNTAVARTCCGDLLHSELRLHVCHGPAVAHSGHSCTELWSLLPRTVPISPLAIVVSFVVMERSDSKAGRML